MQVIINLPTKSNSEFKKFNGLTFLVDEIGSSFISIKGLNEMYPDNKTDFYFNEFLVVGLKQEFEATQQWIKYYGDTETFSCKTKFKKKKKLEFIKEYIKYHKIKFNPDGN